MQTTTEREVAGAEREHAERGETAVRGAGGRQHLQVRPAGAQEAEGLANFLGWFSVGLGVAEMVAPKRLSTLIGVNPTRRNRAVMQAMGVREVVKGIGILSNDRPKDWMWGRVAGDVLDVALLGRAAAAHSDRPERTTAAIGAVLGVTALDVIAAQALSSGGKLSRSRTDDGDIHVQSTVTVNTSPREAYRFWADVENFPRFMRHLREVEVVAEDRSRWTMEGPRGATVEWEVQMVERRPDHFIAWRSVEGAPVSASGSVQFRPAPGERGTEVTLEVRYDPPLGLLGATVAKLFREEPGQLVRDDLRRFKQVIEVGEILLSDATLRRGPRPAQPPEAGEGPGPANPAGSLAREEDS